jgi:hypothetical protein
MGKTIEEEEARLSNGHAEKDRRFHRDGLLVMLPRIHWHLQIIA